MTNRQIERAAVALAKHVLETEGYAVTVEGGGYDLKAQKDGDEIHVEVKGAGKTVSGTGGFRYMTDGEFRAARQDVKWQPWIVENLSDGTSVTLTRIARDEVIANSVMEISWMIKIGGWCRERREPVAEETCAKVLSGVTAHSARAARATDTAEGGCAT